MPIFNMGHKSKECVGRCIWEQNIGNWESLFLFLLHLPPSFHPFLLAPNICVCITRRSSWKEDNRWLSYRTTAWDRVLLGGYLHASRRKVSFWRVARGLHQLPDPAALLQHLLENLWSLGASAQVKTLPAYSSTTWGSASHVGAIIPFNGEAAYHPRVLFSRFCVVFKGVQ